MKLGGGYLETFKYFEVYTYVMTLTIKGKLKKIGNSYHILIPKALIDTGLIPEDKEIVFEVSQDELKRLMETKKPFIGGSPETSRFKQMDAQDLCAWALSKEPLISP